MINIDNKTYFIELKKKKWSKRFQYTVIGYSLTKLYRVHTSVYTEFDIIILCSLTGISIAVVCFYKNNSFPLFFILIYYFKNVFLDGVILVYFTCHCHVINYVSQCVHLKGEKGIVVEDRRTLTGQLILNFLKPVYINYFSTLWF